MGVFSSIRDAVMGHGPDDESRLSAPGEAAREPRPHLVDIENHLDAIPGADHLSWRSSIVDLMTLIGVDSSLESRIALAQELGYPGPADGSQEMDNWLHRRTLQELGGHDRDEPAEAIG